MGGTLPPGVSAGDPNAPWNEQDPPECPSCSHLIGTVDDHADDCPDDDLTQEELAERLNEPSRTWDDVKEDPTPAEEKRYDLDRYREDE